MREKQFVEQVNRYQTPIEWNYHTVKSGDTLSHIAHSYRTKVKDILESNALKSTKIFPGQQLIIPTDI